MTWIDDLGKPPIPHMLPEVLVALDAAGRASEEAMRIYESGKIDATNKADDSPVTAADISCNRIISERLGAEHRILSEEASDDHSRIGAKSVWIVDPLDGTADFVDHTGEFTIMIALVHDDRPVIGVIAQPATQTVFVAQDGAGSYRGVHKKWERIRVAPERDISECRALCSRNHLSETDRGILASLGMAEPQKVGSSIKTCKIAAGESDLYITTTNKMKEWDTCASWCIITEAGGQMTDALGGELTYNNKSVNHAKGIIASSGGRIHELAVSQCSSVLGD